MLVTNTESIGNMNTFMQTITNGGNKSSSISSSPTSMIYYCLKPKQIPINLRIMNSRKQETTKTSMISMPFFIAIIFDRQLPQKMKDFKERQRLGQRKVWLIEKLPPLEIVQQFKGNLIGNMLQRNSNQQPMLKKILRDQEGLIGLNTQSNIKSPEITKEQEIQIMLQGVRPVLKKNMTHLGNSVIVTFKSLEVTLIDLEYSYKPRIMTPIYLPIIDTKEILTMNTKQIEIKIMQSIQFDKESRQFIYKKPSEQRLKNRSPSKSPIKNKFDDKIIKQQQTKIDEILKDIPSYIYSSTYVQSLNKDFQVVIRIPSIDYQVPSKHLQFTKTLSRQELSTMYETAFQQWDTQLLQSFTQYSKFQETLAVLNKPTPLKLGSSYNFGGKGSFLSQTLNKKASQETITPLNNQDNDSQESMEVIEIQELNGDFTKFTSTQDYQDKRVLQQSGNNFKGCFDRDGIISIIKLKPFKVKIKGLSNEYDYKEKIQNDKWIFISKFMKKAIKKSSDDPLQLINLISDKFLDLQQQDKLSQFTFSLIQKTLGKLKSKDSKKDKKQKHQRSQSLVQQFKQYFKFQKRSKMLTIPNKMGDSERYLFELKYPQATLYLEDQIVIKQLSEDDVDYLVENKFTEWKRYLINQHFRMELNISSNEPLPRINEQSREDERDILKEGDFREKYAPKEEEKKTIVETREKLSQWFPI